MSVNEKPLTAKSLPVVACIRNFFEQSTACNRFFAVGALSFTDSRIFNSELSMAFEEFSRPKRDAYVSIDRSEQIVPVLEEEKNFDIYKVPPLSKEEMLEILKFFKQVGLIYPGERSCVFMI